MQERQTTIFYLKINFMKRYFFGIIATAISFCSVAFTAAPKTHNFATKLFAYTGPNYQQANVEDPANWTYISSSNPICSATDVKACQIEVNTMFVNSDNTLHSDLSILTSASSTNVFYVVPGGDITSKSNRN